MNNSGLSDLVNLSSENDLPYLSEVIHYPTDIGPYRLIEIFSGVGSGKNTLVNHFVNGNPELAIPQMTVLIITSRKAKVSELLADEKLGLAKKIGIGGNIHLDLYDQEDTALFLRNRRTVTCNWGDYVFFQQSVACTYAFVEKYIQNVYDPTDPGTHLWNLFDMIVVDEFHSLVMDASYQTAPYYVSELLQEYIRRHNLADGQDQSNQIDDAPLAIRPLCKHFVLMTGTPETVKRLPVLGATPHVIDLMEVCVNVRPKNIRFIDQKQAKSQIARQIADEKRVIYFSNHTLFPAEFCKGTDIPLHLVATSFSKEEKRSQLEKCLPIEDQDRTPEQQRMAQTYADMLEVENSISQDGTIPQRFKLWVTTSRNKEGINLNDKDINDVYVESHCVSDIKQMAGRVRHGAENLYIIVDSCGYTEREYEFEAALSKEHFAPDVRTVTNDTDLTRWDLNAHLKELCDSKKITGFFANPDSGFLSHKDKKAHVGKYINWVHKRFAYVRFDYFRNFFCFYYLKRAADIYDEKQRKLFWEAAEDHSKYVEIFQEAFPTSIAHPYKDRSDMMREYIEALLKDDPKREFTTEELKNHCRELNLLRFDNPKDHLSSPNKLLNPIGYMAKRVCKDKKKPGYDRWRFRRIDSLPLAG